MTLAELEAIQTQVLAVLDGEPVIRVDLLDHAVIRMQSQQLIEIFDLAHAALTEAEETQQANTTEQGTNDEETTISPGSIGSPITVSAIFAGIGNNGHFGRLEECICNFKGCGYRTNDEQQLIEHLQDHQL